MEFFVICFFSAFILFLGWMAFKEEVVEMCDFCGQRECHVCIECGKKDLDGLLMKFGWVCNDCLWETSEWTTPHGVDACNSGLCNAEGDCIL